MAPYEVKPKNVQCKKNETWKISYQNLSSIKLSIIVPASNFTKSFSLATQLIYYNPSSTGSHDVFLTEETLTVKSITPLSGATKNLTDSPLWPQDVYWTYIRRLLKACSQLTFTCSKATIEILEKRCEICSKLTIKTPERREWHRSGVFTINLEHIWDVRSI